MTRLKWLMMAVVVGVCSVGWSAGPLISWGNDSYGRREVPAGTFTAFAAGSSHGIALRPDGSLVGWGDNGSGQTTVPAGNNYTMVAAKGSFSLALKSDGSLAAWGSNILGQVSNLPTGNNFVKIAAGYNHGLAITTTGTIVTWGRSDLDLTNVPAGNNFLEVAAGYAHSLALRSDGTLAGWGDNGYGQATVPSGNDFIAVAAGYWHSLALKSDGAMVAWGYNGDGETSNVPAGRFAAISCGEFHNVALRSDGSLAAWGFNASGECNVPGGFYFTGIGAGGGYSVAMEAPATKTVFPTQYDTRILSGIPSLNLGDGNLIVSDWSGWKTTSLIKFDLTGLTPHFTNAKVRVYLFNHADYGISPIPMIISAKPIQSLDCWTAPEMGEMGITWDNFMANCTLGPDLGRVTINPSQTNSWIDIPIDASLVQGWITGTVPNYGLALVGTSYNQTPEYQFYSRETGSTGQSPELRINYTPKLPCGWWDGFNSYDAVLIAGEGATVSLCYDGSRVQAWLDEANAQGMKVIVQLPQTSLDTQDAAAIRNFVQQYDSHPAVMGWFTLDEPPASDYAKGKTAYDAIKQVSSKPVFVVFCSDDNRPITFADAYDVALYDDYPCGPGQPEFSNFTGYKTRIDHIRDRSAQVGKPWWSVVQAFGRQPDFGGYRLPTARELRFMVYYSIEDNTQGWLGWAHYRAQASLANSGDPYPYDGMQWIKDVHTPLLSEMNVLGSALAAGRVTGSLSDNNGQVASSLWRDPDTGEYYILAMNVSDGNQTATFAVTLSGFTHVQPLFDERSAIHLSSGQFSDSFDAYRVHVYKLFTATLPGDANRDGKVDVSDLGILAANYGLTADATWDKGDFNGDGKVDVSDLGILAANYGTGTGGSLDFNTDAKALGLTVGSEETAKVDTSTVTTFGCASMGLPLIAGLFLVWMLFIKLDE